MNIVIPLRAWFLVGLLVGVGEFSKAQTENPVQKGHTVVEEPVPVSNTRGEIVPLFWKASIDQSVVMLPLRNVEHFGIQDYDVDGATRVRELTITTGSRSMIRIYHIQPLVPLKETAERVERLRQIAEGIADEEYDLPVKVFPSTTHVHMVEYRVPKPEMVDKLYASLESVMVDYHARTLTPTQRGASVRSVSVQD